MYIYALEIMVQDAVWVKKKEKGQRAYINVNVNSQALTCNPQILMKTTRLEEVWRQTGNKILVKTLQKF